MIRQQNIHVSFSIFLLWTSGCVGGSDVSQTPMLWKSVGQDATMECSHTKGAGYYQMYWYRQLPGETMKLVVFTSTTSKDHDFGDFSKEKFSASKTEPETGSFTVKNLEAEDKGLYFCAVSQHSDETTWER
ncbi:immunoglobulin iota chain-like [Xiphophorus maculatus]|uniref:immunoglobulin iota chain-like n=1 Tax=Xiphophorus maculatus TaxID=8083 RepID=UPI000C6D40AF|nr:immunoglobulin iota chain-like [Xiphophorus maculatus]